MIKQEFTSNKFTDFLNENGHDLNKHYELKPKRQLDINPGEWFEFMEKHWFNNLTMHYEPRHTLDASSNEQTEMANRYGYHSGNTLKRDWGKNDPQHDNLFKEMIGKNNFDLLGMDQKTTMVRLLCFTPGNILPVHWDGFEGYGEKYGINDKRPTRYIGFISPWSWGHYLQIHDNFITNWDVGDMYETPAGVLHNSGNGGILPKVTLTFTGLV
jgi:hypothetical protein